MFHGCGWGCGVDNEVQFRENFVMSIPRDQAGIFPADGIRRLIKTELTTSRTGRSAARATTEAGFHGFLVGNGKPQRFDNVVGDLPATIPGDRFR